jgi:hypothetical protein
VQAVRAQGHRYQLHWAREGGTVRYRNIRAKCEVIWDREYSFRYRTWNHQSTRWGEVPTKLTRDHVAKVALAQRAARPTCKPTKTGLIDTLPLFINLVKIVVIQRELAPPVTHYFLYFRRVEVVVSIAEENILTTRERKTSVPSCGLS